MILVRPTNEKGNEGWPAEGTEWERGLSETILIAFFMRTGNFSCSARRLI